MRAGLAARGLVLSELARHLQLAPDQVLAVGDSANDISMLDGRLGFVCRTTSNAGERLKEGVRQNGGYVAEGRMGAGVVEILRHHELLSALQSAEGVTH